MALSDFEYAITDGMVTITGYTDEGGDVVIPSTTEGYPVTAIDTAAFSNCDLLKDVYYTGTNEQWNTISIGRYNTSLTNATIHFV